MQNIRFQGLPLLLGKRRRTVVYDKKQPPNALPAPGGCFIRFYLFCTA